MEYPLKQIYFYLTEGCNLPCRHCWLSPKLETSDLKYPTLDFDLFKSIIAQAKQLGLSSVKLTGGEPLLHPQIKDILKHIKDEKVPLVIETNGTLLDRETAQLIAICSKPFVSVSLDGADADTHDWVRGSSGSFNLAKEGIGHLVEAGLKPQVIMTIMRRNVSQLEGVVRLAESLGCGSVKFNIVQPMERGKKLYDTDISVPIEELIELGRMVESRLAYGTDLKLIYHHPPAFKYLSAIFGNENNSSGCGKCGILGIIGVLADGSFALCGVGMNIQELIFGNADSDPLDAVWRESAILCQLRAGMPDKLEGVCGQCVMKNRCLGNCVAQNYYISKNLWSPFWYCAEAKEKGLFPESRLQTILEMEEV